MTTAISSDIYAEHAALETGSGYRMTYNFGNTPSADSIGSRHITQVYPEDDFSYKKGYGFLTEEARKSDPNLKIDEINDGFSPQYWYSDAKLINPQADENGVYLENGVVDGGYIPLTFKAVVPHQGNYKVTLVLSAGETPIKGITIFSGRRRLESLKGDYCPGEVRAYVFNVNVCDIIPRGHEEVFTDKTIDITVIGSRPVFTTLTIEEFDTPTIYIAGDSTVTDQPACYPYYPESSYCGWGQFFTYYVSNLAAVSNHSHSGLTTESFRTEGHYDIIKKYIKRGDYCLFQFGHNDQKLPHLAADTGYSDNLRRYIDEIRSYGATPVIVTPLARSTWKGSDGTYNDLLHDHAEACKKIAAEKNVPLIDLHQVSMDFIKKVGLTDSVRYFYPKDYTHTNDFGAYLMAGFVAKEIKRIHDICPIPIRTSLCGKVYDPVMNMKRPMTMEELMESDDFVPPMQIHEAQPPAHLKNVPVPNAAPLCKVSYTDLDNCPSKELIVHLAELGYIHNTDGAFNPGGTMSRIDAVNMVTKAALFVPVNVYNDMFTDVVGHEWYAGVVECAYSNDIVDAALLDNKTFKPEKPVTAEELASFCVNAFRSRIIKNDIADYNKEVKCSDWFKKYVSTAAYLGYIDDSFDGGRELTREEAVKYVQLLIEHI